MALRPFHVLVAGHGQLAASMVSAAEMICGAIPGVSAIGLEPGESPEGFEARLRAQIGHDQSTLILADLHGGTPWNVASTLARANERLRVIAGANLGLLIEAVTCTDELDDAMIERLVRLAREAVVDASSRLGTRP